MYPCNGSSGEGGSERYGQTRGLIRNGNYFSEIQPGGRERCVCGGGGERGKETDRDETRRKIDIQTKKKDKRVDRQKHKGE